MGLLDKFKKKNELLDNEQNEEIEAPGWDAIDKLCDKVYGTTSRKRTHKIDKF